VPTGGGKTLSSLAFALEHAIAHGLDRVIYVIPFTSIVDQTADVFRKALGHEDAMLEHHSAFDDDKLARQREKEEDVHLEKLRLATQNWDRPIVVTTAVQFFESLFASKPGRCRKLHNIARSVVILDEAQTLPLKLLRPCLAALNELARGYRTSIVLCTATQPAVTQDAGLKAPEALKCVREIILPERNLYGRLRRVKSQTAGTLTDAQIVEALGGVDQGLVIVNNRRHARELFSELQKTGIEGARHLTTAMTAAHRQSVLASIRDDLASGRPVRLVSTSLIEAGVDVSFQAVWRAWAGLDQIAQAAGRCNRNGELGPEGGRLTIFAAEAKDGRAVPRELEQNAESAKRVLRDGIEPLSPEAVEAYFRELLWRLDDGDKQQALDNVLVGDSDPRLRGIMKAIDDGKHGFNFPFADVAQAFQLIDETMVPVIVPASIYTAHNAPDDSLLASIPNLPSTRGIARKLQRHLVQIPRRARDRLIAACSAYVVAREELGDQFVVLSNGDLYGESTGLNWDDPAFRSAENLVL
jgi:CRISPR-associated endonuclease/helicase Cas3